jgi:hypothetical protein
MSAEPTPASSNALAADHKPAERDEIYLTVTQMLDGFAGAQHAPRGALELGGDLRCDYQQRTTTVRDYATGGTRAGAYTG